MPGTGVELVREACAWRSGRFQPEGEERPHSFSGGMISPGLETLTIVNMAGVAPAVSRFPIGAGQVRTGHGRQFGHVLGFEVTSSRWRISVGATGAAFTRVMSTALRPVSNSIGSGGHLCSLHCSFESPSGFHP